MNIIFRGKQSTGELADSVLSVLKLLRDRYGIGNFKDMDLQLTLLDRNQKEIDLIDATTCEPIKVFEVYKTSREREIGQEDSYLSLVVDNTKEE